MTNRRTSRERKPSACRESSSQISTNCARNSPAATCCRTFLNPARQEHRPGRHAEPHTSSAAHSRLGRYRNLLHNLHAEALQRRNVRRGIAEQPNPMNPEIREDLPAESHLAQNSLSPILMPLPFAGLTMKHNPPRLNRAVDLKAPARVVQVDQRAPS